MNMVRISEFILIVVVVSVTDIALAMNPYDRNQEIVMIPTPGRPNSPPPPGSSSTSQPQSANKSNPDEILGYVFNQINSLADSPLSALQGNLRSDRRIMNGNALTTDLLTRCVQVHNTPQKEIKIYLVLTCRFLTGYVSIPTSTTSIANVDLHPDDNWTTPVRDMFNYLFKNKEIKFSDKLNVARKKIPNKNDRAYISNNCRHILGNTAALKVWQVVGCDFIVLYI